MRLACRSSRSSSSACLRLLRSSARRPVLKQLAVPHHRRFTTSTGPNTQDIARARELEDGIIARSRSHLARAITLVESTRPEDRRASEILLRRLSERAQGNDSATFRIGVSGPPGVGKSTFIESFGMHLVKEQHRVAVLAVDPSSARTGGSILGDKTRMIELSRAEAAYVRPSPTRGTLGGVTRRTSEAILLCEAASYDIVLVETVGVGQSETAVEDMVDAFVLLVPPAGGDELQGIKKGIVELADVIVVNKADGDLAEAARRARAEYSRALVLLRPKCPYLMPQVLACSALNDSGIEEAWRVLRDFKKTMVAKEEFERKRGRQKKSWMWKMLNEELMDRFTNHPRIRELLPRLETQVKNGLLPPSIAADRLIHEFELPKPSP